MCVARAMATEIVSVVHWARTGRSLVAAATRKDDDWHITTIGIVNSSGSISRWCKGQLFVDSGAAERVVPKHSRQAARHTCRATCLTLDTTDERKFLSKRC